MTDHSKTQRQEEKTDPRLLELLVCPLTKGPLTYDASRRELVSVKARLAYPIRDGVPLMTAEAARPLDDDEPGQGRPGPGSSP